MTSDIKELEENHQNLFSKLLNIYQYFSDDARIPTYIKLLNYGEAAIASKAVKVVGSLSQPAHITDYLKYVRAIHLKYYELKKL